MDSFSNLTTCHGCFSDVFLPNLPRCPAPFHSRGAVELVTWHVSVWMAPWSIAAVQMALPRRELTSSLAHISGSLDLDVNV